MDFCKDYLSLVNGEFKGINLTRILDYNEFKEKQYLDSLYPVKEIDEVNKIFNSINTIVDIGFGGGFPILPLAYLYPKKNFFGFEARAKKVKVVFQISKKLGIENICLYHCRVENILFDKKVFILIKAVGKIEDLLSKIFSTTDIYVGFYKGPEVYTRENLEIKNWQLISKNEYNISNECQRNFLVYKNTAIVPHGTISSQFSPFSQFN